MAPVPETPEVFPLRLKCKNCGHTATYHLTSLFISPEIVKAKTAEEHDQCVGFGNYFRCEQCGSAWPWEWTKGSERVLTALMATTLGGADDGRVTFGLPRLFNGAPAYSLAHAEDQLRGMLEREPNNGYVWGRLGNVYEKAGMVREARAAFGKALELNPKDLESHYSMGGLLLGEGKDKEAAHYLHQVVTLAWKNGEVPEPLLRSLVYETVGMLTTICARSNGEIPFLPLPSLERAKPRNMTTFTLMQLDLSEESDRQRLVSMLIGQGAKPPASDSEFSPRRKHLRPLKPRQRRR